MADTKIIDLPEDYDPATSDYTVRVNTGAVPDAKVATRRTLSALDRRKLRKWFAGGIAGKSMCFSGDSTTWHLSNIFGASTTECIYRDGRFGRAQIKYPDFRDVTVYTRGENGGALATFVANGFTDQHVNDPTTSFYAVNTPGNLSDIVAMQCDLYVLSWGINDCRVGTTYTAANLQADLTTAVNTIRAGVPKACIILRMPNAHATDNIGGYMSGGATAQNMMARYQTAYRALRNLWPDVLVWDSMDGLYPNVAPAAAANCLLLNADSLHPSTSAYEQILDCIFGIATPPANDIDNNYYGECGRSNPYSYDQTNSKLIWDQNIDPLILEGPDWYKVYKVILSSDGATWWDMAFKDYLNANSAAVATNAYGTVAPGLVPGDVISFNHVADAAHTFVVNVGAAGNQGAGVLRWYNSPYHPSGIVTATLTAPAVGYVYRHKYAHVEAMRKLQNLFGAGIRSYDAANTTNPYAVARRFYISATPALGAVTLQTIGSETGGDLSTMVSGSHWDTTSVICIPGVTSGAKTAEYNASLVLPLTGAGFTADGTNKRMAITGVTIGGALVDFSKYVIPQGYVLSAT